MRIICISRKTGETTFYQCHSKKSAFLHAIFFPPFANFTCMLYSTSSALKESLYRFCNFQNISYYAGSSLAKLLVYRYWAVFSADKVLGRYQNQLFGFSFVSNYPATLRQLPLPNSLYTINLTAEVNNWKCNIKLVTLSLPFKLIQRNKIKNSIRLQPIFLLQISYKMHIACICCTACIISIGKNSFSFGYISEYSFWKRPPQEICPAYFVY